MKVYRVQVEVFEIKGEHGLHIELGRAQATALYKQLAEALNLPWEWPAPPTKVMSES